MIDRWFSPGARYAPVLIRTIVGVVGVVHGWPKLKDLTSFIDAVRGMGIPLAELFATAAALSEFLGGLALIIGFCTRYAAFFVACFAAFLARVAVFLADFAAFFARVAVFLADFAAFLVALLTAFFAVVAARLTAFFARTDFFSPASDEKFSPCSAGASRSTIIYTSWLPSERIDCFDVNT